MNWMHPRSKGGIAMSFDEIALAYDNSIDWDGRLAREIPFILSCLPMKGRVLDIACGSGHHSTYLSAKGYDVIGFDSSEGMINQAKKFALKQGVSPKFAVGDMRHLEDITVPGFDLIICLGNSLALLPDMNDLKKVFASVGALLNEEGYFLFQLLNFEEILSHNFRYFPIKGGTLSEGNAVIFTRFFQHGPETNYSMLVASSFLKKNNSWLTHIITQKIQHFGQELLQETLAATGFTNTEFFSDYKFSPFLSSKDRNIIVRASHGTK
jgi:SAM-dependent methyltransferase